MYTTDEQGEKRPQYAIRCNFGTAEFRPLSGRWVVERTNSWLENYRRLCRNYERCLSSARAMTYLAAILFMLRYF
ncbi:MAG: transposase [Paramuribaculum sp.]